MENLATDTPPDNARPSTALVRRSPYEQIREMRAYLEDLDAVANALCAATILPKEMQNPANMKLVLWQGIAMGFDLPQSVRASYIIPPKRDDDVPKVGYYVDGLVALVRISGKCRFFRIEETTSTVCRVVCARTDEPENVIHAFELTMEQAEKAGLHLVWYRDRGGQLVSKIKSNWQTSPADMLNARCCGRAVKRVFQDVIFGMTTPEDVEDFHSELAAPQPEFVAAPPRTAKPANAAPASSPLPAQDSAGATSPPAAAAEVVTELDEQPDEGTGDPAWDELVVAIAKLLKVDAGDVLFPDAMRAAWDKAVAGITDRRELGVQLSPAISEASKRASKSKACAELATHMSRSFNDRNAALRKEKKS